MIERIIIENFKSIRKLDLELKPINILIGANGAGKSNFVSFFKLINRVYDGTLNQLIADSFSKLLHFGKRSEIIYGLLEFDKITFIDFELKPTSSRDSGYLSSLNLRQNLEHHIKPYNEWERVWNYSFFTFDQKFFSEKI